ncbi:MAG: hypothetical protein RRC07_14020 [Anaerolineae bacterium]|nr:hypothetical protein [Anaerolineae bacterium]
MYRTIPLTALLILALLVVACTPEQLPEPETALTSSGGEPAQTERTANTSPEPSPTTMRSPVPAATQTDQPVPSSAPEFQLPAGQEPGSLYHGKEDPLPAIAFSPSGDTLATGHRDGRVLLWDVSTGQRLQELDRPVSAPSLGEITALAFSPDGTLLAAAKPGQGSIDLWQVTTGEFERALEVGQGVVEIAFSPDGRRLASAVGRGQRPRVIVWDTESWTEQATLQDVGPTVAFTQDSSTVVTQSGASLAASAPSTDPESAIVLWDVASGQQTQAIPLDGFIVSIDYDAERNLVAANLLPVMSEGADPTPRTLLLDATSGATLHSLAPPPEESTPPPTGPDILVLSPDGSLLAVSYQPNRLDLRQVATGEHLLTLRGPADWLRYPVFSPDGRFLAASSSDGRILFWALVPNEPAGGPVFPSGEGITELWQEYANADYGFGFRYPSTWTLVERPNMVSLVYNESGVALGIGYKRAGDDVDLTQYGGAAGDFVGLGSISFLGEEIVQTALVYQGVHKQIHYNETREIRRGDLIFTLAVRSERAFDAAVVPEEVRLAADDVLASFTSLE